MKHDDEVVSGEWTPSPEIARDMARQKKRHDKAVAKAIADGTVVHCITCGVAMLPTEGQTIYKLVHFQGMHPTGERRCFKCWKAKMDADYERKRYAWLDQMKHKPAATH